MKKIILVTGLAISLIATPALADCPSGICALDINVTTGKVTYTDAVPKVDTAAPILNEPVAPTHTVMIQTATSSFSTSGSLEQVTEAVQRIITAPQAPQQDSCATGGCNKIEIDAITGATTILPLSSADIQQRLINQYMNYARQLEMSIAAREVVIQPYVAPKLNIEPSINIVETEKVVKESNTVTTAITKLNGFSNVIIATKDGVKTNKKQNAKALIRKKKK